MDFGYASIAILSLGLGFLWSCRLRIGASTGRSGTDRLHFGLKRPRYSHIRIFGLLHSGNLDHMRQLRTACVDR